MKPLFLKEFAKIIIMKRTASEILLLWMAARLSAFGILVSSSVACDHLHVRNIMNCTLDREITLNTLSIYLI
jgi:hypothetical protein